MTKHLRFLIVLLMTLVWSAGWAQKVTLDFSKSSNPWKLPASNSKEEKSYSYNGYTISFKFGTSGKGYCHQNYQNGAFLQMGKKGMTLVLPAFDFEVSKIEVVGHSSGNTTTTQNIFVDNLAICDETKGTKGTNTYIIPDTYQTKGTVYKLKVTNEYITKITSIKIYEKETTSTKTSTTLSLGGYANKTFSFTKGKPDDTFTTPTATVTPAAATGAVQYTSSDKDIVTVATNGDLSFTNTKFGSATISAQFIATGDYANSNTITYTVVNKEPQKTATEVTFGDKSQQTITLTEGDVTGVVFPKASEKNNIAGTVSYESSNTDVAVVDVDGNVTIKGAYGEATITATFTPTDAETYAGSTDWYKVVNKVNAAFYESFDKCAGKGGNDGTFSALSGSTDLSSTYTDNEGWNSIKGYVASKCVRFGTRDDKGSATTPSITVTGKGVLSFMAAAWNKDDENITVSVSDGATLTYNGKTSSSISVNMNMESWTNIDNIEISGAKTFTITFAANGKNNRFFLDEVMVKNVAESGETTAITLDENSESNTIEAKAGVNVTLKRTMVKGEWNTICLPFGLTSEQITTVFGVGVKVAQLDDTNSTGATLKFVDMTDTGMEASVPYLIKPIIAAPADGYKFEGVEIKAAAVTPTKVKTNGNLYFNGIYNMVDITKNVTEVLDDTYYAAFLGADNKIYKAKANGNKTKGFRAYFAIPNSAATSALRVVIDGTATSIKNIDSEVVESNAPVYNLQGQRVDGNNLTPGIYVKAGKKFVVK